MVNVSPPERLSDRHDVVLLLRLLVDRHGQVVQGEVGSIEDDQADERWVRFRGADGLLRAVQAVLAGASPSAEEP